MEKKTTKYSVNSREKPKIKENRKDKSRGRLTKFSIVIAIIIIVMVSMVSCFAVTLNIKRIEAKRTQTAIEVVQDLYQFSKVEDLDKNMLKIRNLTTQSVYNQLTVDNEERTLKATSSYILYTLKNKNIDKDRVFIFMYDCNSKGKLSNVRESECLDFLK